MMSTTFYVFFFFFFLNFQNKYPITFFKHNKKKRMSQNLIVSFDLAIPVPEPFDFNTWFVKQQNNEANTILNTLKEISSSRETIRTLLQAPALSTSVSKTANKFDEYKKQVLEPSTLLLETYKQKWTAFVEALLQKRSLIKVDYSLPKNQLEHKAFVWSSALHLSSLSNYKSKYASTCVYFESFMIEMAIAALCWRGAKIAQSCRAFDEAVKYFKSTGICLDNIKRNCFYRVYFSNATILKKKENSNAIFVPESLTEYVNPMPFNNEEEEASFIPEMSSAIEIISIRNITFVEIYNTLCLKAETLGAQIMCLIQSIALMHRRFIISLRIYHWFERLLINMIEKLFCLLTKYYCQNNDKNNPQLALFAAHFNLAYTKDNEAKQLEISQLFIACQESGVKPLMQKVYEKSGKFKSFENVGFEEAMSYFPDFYPRFQLVFSEHLKSINQEPLNNSFAHHLFPVKQSSSTNQN